MRLLSLTTPTLPKIHTARLGPLCAKLLQNHTAGLGRYTTCPQSMQTTIRERASPHLACHQSFLQLLLHVGLLSFHCGKAVASCPGLSLCHFPPVGLLLHSTGISMYAWLALCVSHNVLSAETVTSISTVGKQEENEDRKVGKKMRKKMRKKLRRKRR